MFWTGKAAKNKTLSLTSIPMILTIMLIYVGFNNQISYLLYQKSLLAYYLVVSIISFLTIVKNIGKLTINQMIFLLLSVGGIAEVILLLISDSYDLVNMCNLLMYLVILCGARLSIRYKNLFEP